jgi:tripartite-type tricarboxylate transporter receptor subunit TctC
MWLVGVGAAVIKRRTVLGAAGASLLAAPALGPAFGQGGYPNKPLKMVVPYPPGGGTDGLGRITAERLADKLGQQIIVQNIGGASSTVGSETVRRADPDGYTILFNASLFVLRSVHRGDDRPGSASRRASPRPVRPYESLQHHSPRLH